MPWCQVKTATGLDWKWFQTSIHEPALPNVPKPLPIERPQVTDQVSPERREAALERLRKRNANRQEEDHDFLLKEVSHVPAEDRVVITEAMIERAKFLAAKRAAFKRNALRMFEPYPKQQEFLECTAKEMVVIGGNRSGKTTCAMVRFARIVSGVDPVLTSKRNGTPKEYGRAMVVGLDQSHIGRIIYPKLFKSGAFKMIRDRETREWRAFRPFDPGDACREDEARDAPPLIPPEMIAPNGIAWEEKKSNVPKKVTLINGWEIYFYWSTGKPPQGDSYQLSIFDEEISNSDFYPEVAARLMTGNGYFIWSATPQVGGDDLLELHERAMEQIGEEQPRVREFLLLMDDNPHFSERMREDLKAKYRNRPDEYRVRVLGEFASHGWRVYPEFNINIHGFDINDLPDGVIPADWCRWMVLDPGRQICAVLFAAMPPRGNYIVLFDELYIKDCTAIKLAEMVELKTRGQSFDTALIDSHGGRVHDMNFGVEHETQISNEFKRLKIWDRFRRKGFQWGCDDITAGIEAVHSLLHIDAVTGKPKLYVVKNRLRAFEKEIRAYAYKREGKMLTDKPNQRNAHLMDTARYLALYKPKYTKPKAVAKEKSWVAKRMEAKREGQPTGFVNFGPTSDTSVSSY